MLIIQILHGFIWKKKKCIGHVYGFKQAFDTVDNNVLPDKVEMFGIS